MSKLREKERQHRGQGEIAVNFKCGDADSKPSSAANCPTSGEYYDFLVLVFHLLDITNILNSIKT